MLSAEEKELDQDCFLTIHKSRIFGEYNPTMQKPVAESSKAVGHLDNSADRHTSDADWHEALPRVLTLWESFEENKIHKEDALQGCKCFYCKKDHQRQIENYMIEDPKGIPRSLVYDEGFPVARGHKTPKEINDEILMRINKEHGDKKRREKNL